MQEIDITPEISRFEEHLKVNDRTIFSARFGDGKTWFLNKFMEERNDRYEFIVLYPVNYQIAPNEAIMEYIKRDILFQLILKGKLKPGFCIPDTVLFQWFISKKSGNLFTDVMQVMTSLPFVDSEWQTAIGTLLTIAKEINDKVKAYDSFKHEIESEDDFQKAANIIEQFSSGTGNIYELDMVSYLIIQSIQQIKNEGKDTVLIIEDLDRVDPAHLFRILNVFSAHIDRVYQCSSKTVTDAECNSIEIDTLKNKFGFDKVVMVLDYESTHHIFSHFYGEQANYLGYISKFIQHNVFNYSIHKYAYQQIQQHFQNKCCLKFEQILKKGRDGHFYVDKNDLSLRKIAQVLDGFDNSIVNTVEVIEGTSVCFNVSTPLTRTISTMRRLGMDDENIFYLLSDCLAKEEYLGIFGGFLMKQANTAQGFMVFYKNAVYSFYTSELQGGIVRFDNCINRDVRNLAQYKFLEVDVYDAYTKACSYVK